MILTVVIRMPDGVPWNLLMVYHCVLCFFMFYGIHVENNFNQNKKEMFNILKILVYIPSILSLIGLILAILKNEFKFYGHTLGVKSHRLVGIYENSNTLGLLSVLSIISCCIFLKKNIEQKRNLPIWVLICCILINLICLFLSDSNGSFLFLAVYIVSMIFCKFVKYKGIKTLEKTEVKTLILMLSCVFIVFSLIFLKALFQNIFNILIKSIHLHTQNIKIDSSIEIGRGNYEITSGRNLLILQGLRLFFRFPIMGIGRGNLVYYSNRFLLDRLDYEDLHNGYLTILVSWGALGFFFIMFFLVGICALLLKTLFKSKNGVLGIYSSLFSLMVAYSVYSLFEITLLSSITFSCDFFWVILGYTVCYALNFK
ncbi:MAG: O-antigen ligase family protein [Oscillospiraceae bacterium]|jgi:O-antigen ligase|nr:O-antigen ligase family protein [Oscillospiraceae bacterium]